jgi:hypothetical protein
MVVFSMLPTDGCPLSPEKVVLFKRLAQRYNYFVQTFSLFIVTYLVIFKIRCEISFYDFIRAPDEGRDKLFFASLKNRP